MGWRTLHFGSEEGVTYHCLERRAMVALRRGGVAALVILAQASSFSAIHALPEGSPDQYLAVKLGMPTVRPRPARHS